MNWHDPKVVEIGCAILTVIASAVAAKMAIAKRKAVARYIGGIDGIVEHLAELYPTASAYALADKVIDIIGSNLDGSSYQEASAAALDAARRIRPVV